MSTRTAAMFVLLYGISAAAIGAEARIQLGRIELPGGAASEVSAHIRWDGTDRMQLTLSLGEARAGDRRLRDLRVACEQARWTEVELSCTGGSLSLAGEVPQTVIHGIDVRYRTADGELRIESRAARIGGGTADISISGVAGRWRGHVRTRATDLATLKPLLDHLKLVPEGYADFAGKVDVRGEFEAAAGRVVSAGILVDGKALSFAGRHIAENAELHLESQLAHRGRAAVVTGSAELRSGAVYIEPGWSTGGYTPGITLEATGEPVTARWALRHDDQSGILQIDEFELAQPGVAILAMHGGIAVAPDTPSPELHLRLNRADMRQLYERHVKSHCAHVPALCGMEFEGGVDLAVSWGGEGITDMDLRFHDVYADDDRQRFRIAALRGGLVLTSGEGAIASTLSWARAGWQRLDLGPGSVGMSSSHRSIKITHWSDVEILGGTFKVDRLEIADVGTGNFGVDIEGVLTPIPMQEFSQAMGWPIMNGTLSGVIPGLKYRRGLLTLEGDLLVRVFDGSVVVRGLRIEDPFGQSPVLMTDMDVKNIDLEQLTGAFSFGKIEGTLEGEVRGLRLEDWQPTAFDGYLQNPADDDRRHRISQKAVDNLSAIGGGGIGGALSRGFLSIFKEYSYDRLGLHCRLSDGVCAMKGVAPAENGFYIVTRGGLLPPWIDVKGSGNMLGDGRYGVAWSDILLGFKRINSGQMRLQ
ncbi:MAG: hypothetical protein R3F45_12535 [Gammaproteobacteria bacterium]